MNPSRKKKLIIAGVVMFFLAGAYFGYSKYIEVTDTWIPRPLWYGETVQKKKLSPDGKYEAEVIYLDGLTYGIQFVRLRNKHSIIPFAKKIAIANLEEVRDIEWKSPTEVVIKALPDDDSKTKVEENFETHETSCYGIKISYLMIK